ncbi:gliding motility-associated C-terminal domain-containing protein [Marivirga tractuosa]|uniref:T9SS type B sorting domain-containing protein n=1 Tax=Marivirga tractuosa TaxID=1006 RepID=UPI0035CFF19C
MRSLLTFILLLFSIAGLFAVNPDRLEVVVLSDNNLCDDDLSPTGSAYAVIIEDNGNEDSNLKDYTINWYQGTTTSGTPISVGASYDQMADGTYTVQAIHDKSTFTDEVTITINNTEVGPDAYVKEIRNAKNCKENDGRARVRVRADFPSEGPDHSHDDLKDCKHGICWNFVWYEGNNPFIGDVVAVGADANNLKPGTYAVVVTNESTGCQTVVSLSVGLDAEVPVVDGNVVANITDCEDPTAGALTAFVQGENNNKFEFDWFIGGFVKDAPDFNNMATITGLTAGSYTVVAKEKSSGCSGNPLTLTVEDLTSIPDVLVNLDQEQTSCDPANPNGAVSATADGTTSGYDFEWFEGQNTLDANLIGTTASLTNLATGFYTVRATNISDPNSQNCSSTAEIEVTETLTFPTNINGNITDQTFCINPNGSISANVDGATSGYNFYWFDGNIASPDINNPDFTGTSYNSLLAGDYTLVVQNNTTLCTSDPEVFTVADQTSTPVIALASSSELTSCNSPNGAISVTAEGGTSGFDFQWFNGSSTAASDEITPSPGASISGLNAGTYTVLATDQTTGCSETYEHTVLDNRVTPVPTTTITDQTQCDPLNGEIQASVGGTTAGYNFYWFDGNIAAPDISSPDRTGATISGLVAGNYTLVVEDDASKCLSSTQVLTVEDLTPTISGAISLVASQTSCDTTAPNGELSVTANGGTSYTYEWFVGSDATGSSFASGISVSGLSAQTYTVLITDASGCTDEVSYDLPEEIKKPLIDIDPTTDIIANTVCDPSLTNPAITYSGAIQSAVTYDGTAITLSDYRFDWYTGTDTSVAPVFTGTGEDSYTNIADGTYTLVVTRITAGLGFDCSSDPVTVVVPNERESPVGTISLDFAQSSCDPAQPNGQLTASALTGGSASAEGYTYEWFVGGDTSAPFDPATDGTISGTDGEEISELSAQTYTLLVTDLSSGCQDEVSYALPEEIKKPVIDIDPTNDITANTVCDPFLTNPTITYSGAIQSAVTYDGAAITLSDYRFDWYTGTDTSVAPVFTGTGEDSYTNIADGTYTLVVTRITAGPGFDCSSDPVTVVVPNERESPVGTISLDFAQSSCDPAQPNGQLTASALTGGSASAAGYTYEWFVGGDTSTPFDPATDGTISGTDGEEISELSAQTYTLLVTDLSSGCQDEVSYALPEEIKKPVIDIDPTNDITANTVCDPSLTNPTITYSGAIQSAVTYDGAAITLSDYRFDWYTGTDTSLPVAFSGLGADNYTDLAPGDYTLIVTKEATGPGQFCSSEAITVTVPNDITTPTASINKDALQTSCGSPNGQLTTSALTGGAASAAGYTYEWFVGTDTSTPFNNGVDGDVIGGDGETIQNIDAGDYAVRVTDLASGCQTVQNIYLDENIIDPVVEATVTTPFVDCNTDVEITPNITSANAAPNGHDFTWYEGQFASGASLVTTTDDGASPVLSEPNTGVAIYSGYYTVVATDRYTGCVSDPFTIFVDRPIPQFNVAAQIYLKPAQCTDNDGIITAFVDSNNNGVVDAGEADYSDWTFEWYQGSPIDANSNFYTNPEATFLASALEVDPNNVNSGGVPPPSETSPPPVFAEEAANPNAGATIYSRITNRYTVVVTDKSTGCKEFLVVDLPYVDGAEVTVAKMDVDNSTNCSTPNGRLEVLDLNNIASGQDFDDYIYNWYDGTNEAVANIITDGGGNDIETAVLDQINGTPGLTPGYYTVVPIETFGSKCRLTPHTVFLDSAARQPELDAAITPNTSCVGNGEITITPSKGAGDTTQVTTYSYSWSSGETTATISDKLPGDYTVTVTDDDTDCFVTKTYTIRDERVTPEISNIIATPQFYCNANGTLRILDTDITPGIISEYDFTVYLNGTNAGNIITPTQNAVAGGVEFTDLGAGTYYVSATRNVAGADAEGCTSAFIQEVVADELDPVVLNLSQEANTACDPTTNSDASIELTMSTPSSDGSISGANYNITVDNQPGATLSNQTGITSPFVFGADAPGNGENVLPGSYTFTIENTVSGCVTTRSITVEDNPEPIIFSRSDLNVRGAEYCVPSGRIEVNNIGPAAVSDYTFTWYEGKANYDSNTPIGGVNGPLLDSMTYANIGAGVYYVVATRDAATDPGSGCSSVGVRVEIPDAQVEPTLALSQTVNTACDADPNSDATITVNMSTPSGYLPISSSNYDITFTSKPAGATVADVTDVASPYTFTSAPGDLILPGSYTVELFNRESECITTRSITVEDNPEPIVFSRSDLNVRGAEYCVPSGRIEVNNIGPTAVSDYTFTWYEGKANYDSNTPIGGVNGPLLDSMTYAHIGAGVYYVVATRDAATDPGSGCSSVGVRVEIPDAQVEPTLALSQTVNTACDADPNSDATITVNMSTPSGYLPISSSNYDITFTSKPAGATVADVTDVASPYTFTSAPGDLILPGSYTIEVFNRESECITTRSITVEDNPEPIIFSRSDLNVRGAEYCVPSGRIEVNNIGPAAVSDYTFTWYEGKANYDSNTPIGGVNGPLLDSMTYAHIGAGVYYVVATRDAATDPGSGCSSVGVRVEIPDAQVEPTLALSQTVNTACDADPNSDATITVNMSTPSGYLPISSSNYDITFTSKPAGATVADVTDVASPYTFTSAPGDLILPGSYTIELFNRESECITTRSITVEDNPEPIVLRRSDFTVVNSTNCSPSGSIEVNNIAPNTPAGVNDYIFTWYDGETDYTNNNPISGVSGSILDNTNYATIHPGVYYVLATRNVGVNPGSSCISNAVRVEILDVAVRPDIVIVENDPNSSCDPTNPNGSMSASVNGETLTDYTFEWFTGLNNTTNAVDASLISGAAGETVSGLAAGNYTVRVTDNTAPGEACSSIKSFYLSEDLTISVAKNVTFDITFQSDCFDSGSITVASLNPGAPSDFTYEWYYESYDGNGLISGETTASLTGRPAGSYYVIITNSATSCVTDNPIEVEIPFTASSPAIELTDAKPNTDCNPVTPDGFLEVAADGGQTSDYTFTWYEGGLPIASDANLIGNANRLNELDSGYYSVIVYSAVTNCSDTAQFYVEFLPELPKISLSTSPVTNCGSPNGSAYAQIYNLDGNFEFNWYIGTSIKNQPDFTGPWQRDLPVGEYIVEAIDLDAPDCVSDPVSFTITERIEEPQLKLNQISPNTYCDPEKVNGVAEAILYYVDEDDPTDSVFVTSNFEVLWYRTASLPDSTAEFNGRKNSELSAAEYTVTYRNVTTNCLWEENIVITEDLTVIPPPEVEITEMFDSCEEPNGAAEISASDLNPNYIYKWYLNEISDIADFETTEVAELEIGNYLVTATDTVSGCISEPREVEITDNRKAPIINLTLEPENCGDYNGVASISINSDYEYRAIEWETPYGTAFGESFDEFTAGDYSVTVIGSNGCAYTEEFTITSEINVYNGVSPNNDGENDTWEIGCIENFQQNKVEIYNRAGALVFAAQNYGNNSNAFEGLGNRGVYAGEKKLPDGTYFYIIDKGDGSEVVKGYLELFR